MTNDIYRHFALVGFLVYWTSSLYMIHRWWGGRSVTFSLHAASNKTARKLFAIAVTIETVLYLLFAFKWFIPYYGMPFIFGVLISLTAIGHLIAGLIPETKGLSRQIHRKASYWSVALFIPEFLIICLTPTIAIFVRLVAGIFLAIIVYAWYLFLFKLNRKEDILNQALYIMTLPIVLILAAYIR
jgi:hypothetical protein